MRRFRLLRTHDVTGVSGTGYVAEGVVFSDGKAAMRWLVSGRPNTTVIYDSMADLIEIHDHKGTIHENTTEVEWID